MKYFVIALLTLGFTQTSQASEFDLCEFFGVDGAPLLTPLLSSTFLGPFGTTTGYGCLMETIMGEIDKEMLEREAVMALEEGKFFRPSPLFTYAKKNQYPTLKDAALDVLENGVR